jgi:DNA-binding CsgD family transcriptional regulator
MTGKSWPLIGRNAELDGVDTLLREGRRSGVVLVGEPGAGKTRLGVECLNHAQDLGYATCRVKASKSASDVPFGAFRALLPVPASDGPVHRETACQLSCALRSISPALAPRPVAVLVDDAHLLDAESALLVHQLAVSGAAFLILTVGAGAVVPGPVVALWKDEVLVRIDLSPVDRTDVGGLLSAVTGGPVDQSTGHHFAERTRGNPQLLCELVQSALDAGALCEDGGVYRLVAPPPLSTRLVELVEAGLSDLSREERDVLEVCACAGALGVKVLASLSDPGCIDVLVRRRLLAVDRQGQRREVRRAHPLQGDVLRMQIPATREQAICRALAEAVERAGMHRHGDVGKVAGWRLDGGGPITAGLAITAACEAKEHGDLELATRLADVALQSDEPFAAALLAGYLASFDGTADLGEREMEALAPLARSDEQRAVLAVARAANLHMRAGRPEDALRVVVEAERAIGTAAWRDEVSAKRAFIHVCNGADDAAISIAEPLMLRGSGVALSEACAASAIAHSRAGRHEAALRACRTGEGAAGGQRQLSLQRAHWMHAWIRCQVLVRLGDLAAAECHAQHNYEQAVVDGAPAAQAAFAQCLSLVSRTKGRITTAVAWAREAVALTRRRQGEYPLRWALAELGSALVLLDEKEEAAAVLQEYDERTHEPHPPTGVPVEHTKAWLAAAQGDLPSAHARLRDLAGRAASRGWYSAEAAALHDLVRLGGADGVAGRLSELSLAVEGPLMRSQAQHAVAMANQDGGSMDAAANQFERIGACLLAAEAAASASQLWRSSGEGQRASAAERRAALLARRCDGAVTPVLARVASRAALTAREREVAALAAAGLSNRDITKQLFVSVRTVENQLQRAYAKLGVRSRTELAGALESQLST